MIRSFCSTVKDMGNQTARFFIPSFIEAGFQDVRVGKIVGGLVLSTTGIGILGKSGFLRKLKSWVWCEKSKNKSKAPIINWKVATLGLTTTGFGIHLIVDGVYELFFQKEEQVVHVKVKIDSLKDRIKIQCDDASWTAKIKECLNNVWKCPSSKTLLKETLKEGSFTFVCKTQANLQPQTFFDRREVVFHDPRATLTDVYDGMIFEVSNLLRSTLVLPFMKNMCGVSPVEFALTTEMFEFETIKISYVVERQCSDGGFTKSFVDVKRFLSMKEQQMGNFGNILTSTSYVFEHTIHYLKDWLIYCHSPLRGSNATLYKPSATQIYSTLIAYRKLVHEKLS